MGKRQIKVITDPTEQDGFSVIVDASILFSVPCDRVSDVIGCMFADTVTEALELPFFQFSKECSSVEELNMRAEVGSIVDWVGFFNGMELIPKIKKRDIKRVRLIWSCLVSLPDSLRVFVPQNRRVIPMSYNPYGDLGWLCDGAKSAAQLKL